MSSATSSAALLTLGCFILRISRRPKPVPSEPPHFLKLSPAAGCCLCRLTGVDRRSNRRKWAAESLGGTSGTDLPVAEAGEKPASVAHTRKPMLLWLVGFSVQHRKIMSWNWRNWLWHHKSRKTGPSSGRRRGSESTANCSSRQVKTTFTAAYLTSV